MKELICKASFMGTISRNDFYQILESIDKLKLAGFIFETHERIDYEYTITFKYILHLYTNKK